MLVYNWKEIAKGAWSMWAFYAALILEMAQQLLPWVTPGSQASFWLNIVLVVVLATGAIARLVKQKEPKNV